LRLGFGAALVLNVKRFAPALAGPRKKNKKTANNKGHGKPTS